MLIIKIATLLTIHFTITTTFAAFFVAKMHITTFAVIIVCMYGQHKSYLRTYLFYLFVYFWFILANYKLKA